MGKTSGAVLRIIMKAALRKTPIRPYEGSEAEAYYEKQRDH